MYSEAVLTVCKIYSITEWILADTAFMWLLFICAPGVTNMQLLVIPAETFGREFWAVFRIEWNLCPPEKTFSVGLFPTEEMPLNRPSGEVGLLIQPCPKTQLYLCLSV